MVRIGQDQSGMVEIGQSQSEMVEISWDQSGLVCIIHVTYYHIFSYDIF